MSCTSFADGLDNAHTNPNPAFTFTCSLSAASDDNGHTTPDADANDVIVDLTTRILTSANASWYASALAIVAIIGYFAHRITCTYYSHEGEPLITMGRSSAAAPDTPTAVSPKSSARININVTANRRDMLKHLFEPSQSPTAANTPPRT